MTTDHLVCNERAGYLPLFDIAAFIGRQVDVLFSGFDIIGATVGFHSVRTLGALGRSDNSDRSQSTPPDDHRAGGSQLGSNDEYRNGRGEIARKAGMSSNFT